MVSVGTIVWLSSELMFFAALFACYYTIRAVSPELWADNTALLNVPFAGTIVVVALSAGAVALLVWLARHSWIRFVRGRGGAASPQELPR